MENITSKSCGGGKPNAAMWSGIIFIAAAVLLITAGGRTQQARMLALLFSSIVLEALPFMLIGALAGGFIEEFVSRERLAAVLAKCGIFTVFIAASIGILFPVCECAIVPVVRRLARKGLPVSAVIAFLLAAPIVNPVVAASTAVAYKLDFSVVAYRLILGYLIAVGIGFIFEKMADGENVFVKGIRDEAGETCHHEEHDHSHDECSCGCGHNHTGHGKPITDRLLSSMQHAGSDFMAVGHYLVIGAFIAAAAQTFIGRSALLSLTSNPILMIPVMMVFAIILNLCSEADAFIAASLRSLVPFPAQLAFMLCGPMFDIKLLMMYRTLFKKDAIWLLATLILSAVLAVTLLLHYTR